MVVCCMFPLLSSACDLCSVYLGINPKDYTNSFGLVNRFRVFEMERQRTVTYNTSNAKLNHLSTIPTDVDTETEQFKETYMTYDLWAKVFINKLWQINASVSFSDNYQYYNDETVNNVSGVGDFLVLSKHQLYNTKATSDTVKFRHRLIVGGGVKLPTGSFNKQGMLREIDHHLQPGTGSVDFIGLIEYLVRYNNTGINANVVYRYNTANRNDFRFANRFNYDISIFHLFDKRKLKWMPTTGIAFESSLRDELNNTRFLGSGGEALFLTFGAKLFYQNVSLGLTCFSKPIHEDLYDAPLQLNNAYRAVSELVYYF